MLAYTAGDSLQAIANTYGFDTVRGSQEAINVPLAARRRSQSAALRSWSGLVLALILHTRSSLPLFS
jgi:hypothetical protein